MLLSIFGAFDKSFDVYVMSNIIPSLLF